MEAPADDLDLNAAWEEAVNSFTKTTKTTKWKKSGPLSPDQVAEAITSKAKKSHNPTKWEKLGHVAARTGTALLEVGKVAAQVAGMVSVAGMSLQSYG